MAKKITAYQTTDGRIWELEEEAAAHQKLLDVSGENPEIRAAIEKAFSSLPEYGKSVGKSLAEAQRELGNLTALSIFKDLMLSYTSQFAAAMGGGRGKEGSARPPFEAASAE